MAIYTFRTSAYAMDVYLFGNRPLSAVVPEYIEPVKKYAAAKFTLAQIDNALANGWITQQEYDDTLAYRAA